MTRIVIAGFQHETNTFGVTRAHFSDFELADAWPGLLRGEEVISGTAGSNLPLAGFVEAARATPSMDLVPVIWCSAEPCSYVTDDAFERISAMLLNGLADAGEIDGIYLDLHGAMVTESHEDGEGEVLARIRRVVGDALPIAVSLDLHANVTERMVEHASSLTIFRTYPHLDMAETGARAHAMLLRHLRGEPIRKAFRQAPFLVPLSAQYTGAAPCRELYAALNGPVAVAAVSADIALGFPPADIHDAGPSVVAYGATQEDADRAADGLIEAMNVAEARFDDSLLTPADAVAAAMAAPGKPVVIADVQDNPGAGGTSDTTGLLAALVEGGAQGAVLALLDDPEIAGLAHRAGIGTEFDAALGGKSGVPGQMPYRGRFRVEALSDGHFAFSGEMYAGSVAELGPTAVLKVLDTNADVRAVVGSTRCQCLDQAVFAHIGIDPGQQRILGVKSTVHFRADFEPIAETVLNVEAPGVHPCRLDEVPYRRLRPGVRLGPCGRPFRR
jgi:microcystin degradation protein MlrC